MICLHCMFSRHRETQMRKADECDGPSCLKNVYLGRASRIEQELLGLKCTCSVDHEEERNAEASG